MAIFFLHQKIQNVFEITGNVTVLSGDRTYLMEDGEGGDYLKLYFCLFAEKTGGRAWIHYRIVINIYFF